MRNIYDSSLNSTYTFSVQYSYTLLCTKHYIMTSATKAFPKLHDIMLCNLINDILVELI